MKYIAMLGLLLSVLFHIAVFNTFIITFSARPGAPRPWFTFLGGILQQQDLFGFKQPSEAPQNELSRAQINLTRASLLSVPGESSAVQKPFFSEQAAGHQKVILKSNWEEFADEPRYKDMNQDDFLREIGIDPEPPARVPLRLNTGNDKN